MVMVTVMVVMMKVMATALVAKTTLLLLLLMVILVDTLSTIFLLAIEMKMMNVRNSPPPNLVLSDCNEDMESDPPPTPPQSCS